MHRRVALAVAATLATAPLVSMPAQAIPVSAYGIVWMASWEPGTAYICAQGEVDDGTTIAGLWTFTIAGAHSGPGDIATPPVIEWGSSFAARCLAVPLGAPPYRVLHATLTFSGVSTPDSAGEADVVSVAGFLAIWHPFTFDPNEVGYSTSS